MNMTTVSPRVYCRSFIRVLVLVMAMHAGHLSGAGTADVGGIPESEIAIWRKMEGITTICSLLRNNKADFAADVARRYGLQSEELEELNENDETDETQHELRLQPDVAAAVFDTFLYGSSGLQVDEAPVGRRLESILRKRISSINELCRLTDHQKEKLRLAGTGDIKRLFDSVAAQRKRFVAAVDGESPSSSIELVTNETSRIRNGLNSGPFEHDSFFAKVLRSHLTPTQVADYNRRKSNLSLANRKAIPEVRLAN
jgi:hypothetical protein